MTHSHLGVGVGDAGSRGATYMCVCHDSFMCVTHLYVGMGEGVGEVGSRGAMYTCVCHDSFICVTRLVYMWVWVGMWVMQAVEALSICVCVMTHSCA